MNSNAMNSTDQPAARPSISSNRAYTQALADLIAVEVAASQIEERTAGFEVNPAFTAAQEAVSAGWNAVAAVVDAHCARQ